MLNPSTADALKDDPTIKRCVAFAKTWGNGGLVVTNLFALRSTYPEALYNHADPVGPINDAYISYYATQCKTICAWGNHGQLKGRAYEVEALLEKLPFKVYALKIAQKSHTPSHPLYLKQDLLPISFCNYQGTHREI